MKKILSLLLIAAFLMATVSADPSYAADKKKWTVLIFLNADNNLEGAGLDDVNEMELVGSDSNINIVVQIDRVGGYTSSEGDWTTCRRYYVKHDTNIKKINSELIKDMGEVNMGDVNVFTDFVEWGVKAFPAEHYFVALWNHGSGWKAMMERLKKRIMRSLSIDMPGGNVQPLPLNINYGISYDDTSNHAHITTEQMGQACKKIKNEILGGKKLDVLGYDACLMAMGEVMHETKDSVKMTVSSQETEPGDGWPYDKFLAPLKANPNMSPAEFSTALVDAYKESYNGGSQGTSAITQSAIDCERFQDTFIPALNKFCVTMMKKLNYLGAIQEVQNKTQHFYYADNKDIYHFAELLKAKVEDTEVKGVCQNLMTAIDETVVRNGTTQSKMANAHGIALYFPKKGSYSKAYDKLNFCKATKWDDFIKETYDPKIPILKLNKHLITDENGDGKYSPGEKIKVNLFIENSGGANAEGVKVTLDAKNPEMVDVLVNEAVVGTVQKKTTVEAPELKVKISEDCAPNTKAKFIASIIDGEGNVMKTEFSIVIKAPFVVKNKVLLVAADMSDKYTDYYTEALSANNVKFDLWDVKEEGKIDAALLKKYVNGVVLWNVPQTSSATSLKDSAVQSNIAAYLNAGGNLFVTGQDIGYNIKSTTFYKKYFHAKYINDDTNIDDISGFANFRIKGGDGASNQKYPDEIDPLDGAKAILKYADKGSLNEDVTAKGINSTGTAGLSFKGDYKLIYFGFGFEGIATAKSRKAVMKYAIDFLKPGFSRQLQNLITVNNKKVELLRQIFVDPDNNDLQADYLGVLDDLNNMMREVQTELIDNINAEDNVKVSSFVDFVSQQRNENAQLFIPVVRSLLNTVQLNNNDNEMTDTLQNLMNVIRCGGGCNDGNDDNQDDDNNDDDNGGCNGGSCPSGK